MPSRTEDAIACRNVRRHACSNFFSFSIAQSNAYVKVRSKYLSGTATKPAIKEQPESPTRNSRRADQMASPTIFPFGWERGRGLESSFCHFANMVGGFEEGPRVSTFPMAARRLTATHRTFVLQDSRWREAREQREDQILSI